ncbi:MAG: hypothetical protein QOG94_3450 [Solirubrobacteraceae bacterium]|jgi:DNA-binding CsgD family transcriptional regulator|nr:hypothetical protein [Solirubrobacteraceae bacterium]
MPTPASARLVGRDEEREVLERAARSVTRGGPARVVEIVGEAGIGKTTLLGTIGGGDHERLVLTGRAAEFERELPFGVFIDALDEHVASAHAAGVLRGIERTAELAAVFPSLEGIVGAPAKLLATERFRLHRAVRALLERLALARPLVLVLDDLHWADPASCELLASLLLRPPRAALLLAIAYRTGCAPAALALALVRPEAPIVRIELGPLTHADSMALLGDGVRGRAARDLLYRESGGNPFYLEQLARAPGIVAGALRVAGAPLGHVPQVVASVLAEEVAALSTTAQEVVRAAAIAGEPFEPQVVALIADVELPLALSALDELLENDLIRETPIARRFRFRHPLVRQAVYGSITGGRRLTAHARAAQVLAERGAGPMVCATHIEQSATVGDEAAIELLAQAGAAAAGRAPESSARWWQAALRLVPERGALSELSPALLPEVAAALTAAGRLDDSHATWLRAVDPPAGDERGVNVAAVAGCANVERLLGLHDQALRRLLAARDACLGGSRETALVELELSACSASGAPPQFMCDCAQRALDIGRALMDPGLQVGGTALLSLGRFVAGETAAANAAYDDAARLLSTLDDHHLAGFPDTVYYLAMSGWMMGRFQQAERHFARGTALSRRGGRNHLLMGLMSGRSNVLCVLGRLADALELADECLEAAGGAGPMALVWAQTARCAALTEAGRIELAVDAGQQAVVATRALNMSPLIGTAAWRCAGALVEAGAHQRAIDLLLESLGGPDLPLWFVAGRPLVWDVLARAELGLEHHEAAAGWARRSAAVAAALGVPISQAFADRSGAEVLLARGDAGAAAVLAEAAAEHAAACSARIEAARAHLLSGRAHAADGARARAGELLRVAEAEFAACGAQRCREQSVRELRRIGRRVSRSGQRAPSGSVGVAALSGREREVALLVCEHRTNREIAAHLFLSEKTIESHLRSIFVKLGASSRAQVARSLHPPPDRASSS